MRKWPCWNRLETSVPDSFRWDGWQSWWESPARHAPYTGDTHANKKGVALFDGFTVASFLEGVEQNGADYWSMDAAQLVDLLNGFQKQVGKRVVLPSIADPTMRAAVNELPRSFAFKTRDGRHGVLELLAITENPPGARIRYKLVENKAATSAPSSDANPAVTRELGLKLAEGSSLSARGRHALYFPADRSMGELFIRGGRGRPIASLSPGLRQRVANH